MPVMGIGIGSGQYYWILGIGWLSWYRSNPNYHRQLPLDYMVSVFCLNGLLFRLNPG